MAHGVSVALCKARKECFSDEDRYWHGSNANCERPLNPRNEAVALSRLLVSREGECVTAITLCYPGAFITSRLLQLVQQLPCIQPCFQPSGAC